MERTSPKTIKIVTAVILIIMIVIGMMCVITRIPPQNLKITAQTATETFDISGTTDIYYFRQLNAGKSYNARIRFMAVENSSARLFTSHGTGQFVELGCDDLKADYGFISFGRFLHIRLTLNAAQTDLKLEDGTPFDITRYSLRPVLTVEER